MIKFNNAWKSFNTAQNSVTTYDCSLSEVDVASLIEAGIISKIDRKESRGFIRVFTVAEVSKRRRRFICDPVEVNLNTELEGRVELPSVPRSLTSWLEIVQKQHLQWIMQHFFINFYLKRKLEDHIVLSSKVKHIA